MSPATQKRAVQAFELETKKIIHATGRGTERVKSLRAASSETVQAADFTYFKFVDKTSTDLTYCRRCARAEGGQRAPQPSPCTVGRT